MGTFSLSLEGAKVNYVGSDPVHFSYLWMVVNR